MKYQPVIGLEIHVQLNTKSKMFCSCPTDYFGKDPNTNTCPVCLALPGALPVPNEQAINKVIKMGLALKSDIAEHSKFDRKNYFYPDLPKGYQISQYDMPLCFGGYIEIENEGDSRRIRITRVHLEEDTGKSIYQGKDTLIDFNKSGVPLMEIVTKPDFVSSIEVIEFAKNLKQIMEFCDISNCNMERGQIRFELNISLRASGTAKLPNYKVEIKNIGSISFLGKAIEYEIKRQSEILDSGKEPLQETRGYIDKTGKTVSQRMKEKENDYRYFPEPDIPPMSFTKDKIENIRKTLGELPAQKIDRYCKDYHINKSQAASLVSNTSIAKIFEEACSLIANDKTLSKLNYPNEVANWLIGEITMLYRKADKGFDEFPFDLAKFSKLIELILTNAISGKIMKDALQEWIINSNDPIVYIEKNNLLQISDRKKLRAIISKVIKDNPKVAGEISKNQNVIKYLMGLVMKESRGKANPQVVDKILRKEFSQKE